MSIQLTQSEGELILQKLDELLEISRSKRKPKKKTAIEKNIEEFIATTPRTGRIDKEAIRRKLLGLK